MKKLSLFFAALFCATTMSAAITFDPQGGTHVTAPADNAALLEEFETDHIAYTGNAQTKKPIQCDTNGGKSFSIATFLSGATAKNVDALTNEKSPCKWLGDYLKFRYPTYFTESLGEVYWRHEVHGFFHCTDGNDATSCGYRSSYTKQDWSTYGQPESWTPYYLFLNKPTLEGKAFAGWYTDAACTAGNEITLDNLATVADGATLYAKWEGSIAISNITLDKETAIIAAGQTGTIVANVSPVVVDEVFTVESSDKTVATVTLEGNNIIVKAIQGGTATISAIYKAGKADCAVTVTEAFAINLHEGTLENPANQDAAIQLFVDAFHAYPNTEDRGLPVSNVVYKNGAELVQMLTTDGTGWKWLGDYLIAHTDDLETPLTAASLEGNWRATVHGFFNCLPSALNQIGDYSVAGCLGVWRPYYVLAQTPTLEGKYFAGWYLDAAYETKADAATLPASGELHAKWSDNPQTALENVAEQVEVRKVIENGQLVIIRDGVRYNALGAQIK